MPSLPTPLRAALGVVAIARDTIQNLPDKAIELPMLAVSTALQMSLRAQQRYAALAARGDDLLAGQRTTDEPPPWARFDEEPAIGHPRAENGSSNNGPDEATSTPPRKPPRTPVKTVNAPRNGTQSAFDAVDD